MSTTSTNTNVVKRLNAIKIHDNLSVSEKEKYVYNNIVMIFMYTLCLTISFTMTETLKIFLYDVNTSKERKVFYCFVNLLFLIGLTAVLTYFMNIEVIL